MHGKATMRNSIKYYFGLYKHLIILLSKVDILSEFKGINFI